MVRHGKSDNITPSTDPKDPNYKRFHYIRYGDSFIMGLDGSRKDGVNIKSMCIDFLKEDLKLTLGQDRTKIIHAQSDSAMFLGYKIHKTPVRKMKVAYNAKGQRTRRVTRTLLDAPVNDIVEKLIASGYAKKDSRPTRNGRFMNYTLPDIINHFKKVERGILQYYKKASNYGRVSARVNYILKYSCALTLASKMGLISLRKVFKRYGPDLKIWGKGQKLLAVYPKIKYSKPKSSKFDNLYPLSEAPVAEKIIDSLDKRILREQKGLEEPCVRCGSWKNLETQYYVERPGLFRKNKNPFRILASRVGKKEFSLCRDCYKRICRRKVGAVK